MRPMLPLQLQQIIGTVFLCHFFNQTRLSIPGLILHIGLPDDQSKICYPVGNSYSCSECGNILKAQSDMKIR